MHDWLSARPWAGRTALIVAGGKSAGVADLAAWRGRVAVLTVNEAWRLAPWADALYAADEVWWQTRRPPAEAFAGLRITPSRQMASLFGLAQVKLLPTLQMQAGPPGQIGNGGHGGFQALNLAAQAGASTIVLVGFDYHGPHWHGRHASPLSNPGDDRLERWARLVDAAAGTLAGWGVTVLNASRDSRLAAYPKVELAALLAPA